MSNNKKIKYYNYSVDPSEIKNNPNFPICPICTDPLLYSNPVQWRGSISLFCCDECYRHIKLNIPSTDFCVGVCYVSDSFVSAPFSLINRKPTIPKVTMSETSYSYFDIDNATSGRVSVQVPSNIISDEIWTVNMPVYVVVEGEEYVISPVYSDINSAYVSDTDSSNTVGINNSLYYEEGRFVIKRAYTGCPKCKKISDVTKELGVVNVLTTIFGYTSKFISKITRDDYCINTHMLSVGIYGGDQSVDSATYLGSNYEKICRFSLDSPARYLYRFGPARMQAVIVQPLYNDCIYIDDNRRIHELSSSIEEYDKHCNTCNRSRESSKCTDIVTCVKCGNGFWTDKHNNVICKLCQSGTQSHTFNVMSVLKTKRLSRKKIPMTIPMGVELEICTDYRPYLIKSIISEHDGNFVFKWDGSIDMDRGVEVVSSPMLYKEHMESKGWGLLFSGKFCKLVKSNACGMHVHVPRSAMQGSAIPLDAYTLQKMMYSYENRPFMEHIASRPASNQYAPFDGGNYRAGRRYTGLNFHTGSNKTVEYRIFKSPVDFEGMKTNLQFVDAFTSFVRNISSIKKSYSYFPDSFKENGFFDFVQENTEFYPSLASRVQVHLA
jgi:hypothetical protein